MRKFTLLLTGLLFSFSISFADIVIQVQPNGSNDIKQIKDAIEEAKTYNGEAVTIKLGGGTYLLKKSQATKIKHYISNTLGWGGPPDNIKHVGINIKSAQNITLDGEGARLITHGEMTPVVIDESENITLKNLIFDAADPSVTEMTVESIEGNAITYKVHETSNYTIAGNQIRWYSDYGWSFTGGPVQLYDPEEDITWRTGSPTDNVSSINNLSNKRIKINYNSKPGVKVGYTYQMRHGTRNEVAGFILKSKDIVYDNVKMYFMGNFGIVNQFSENITYTNCYFAPEEGSGRTNAGFADFLQFSGTKGLLKIEDTYFSGAHDDPINIHGTYLKIQSYISSSKARVKFMHNESWGFEAFFVGDSIEFINVATMQTIEGAVVTEVVRNDDFNITLTFDKEIDVTAYNKYPNGVVIENTTWTPEVEIRRNYFSRVPTRGVLITTRGKSIIEDNTFYKMQMAGIYVSGDAANWYESGKVTDLTIRNNKFVECGNPVIYFDPTNSQHDGQVHSNVTIDNNEFFIKSGNAVGGKSVKNLDFTNNTIVHAGSADADSYVSLSNSANITKSANKKIQPGTISLNEATTESSSDKAGSNKDAVIDGAKNTSWYAEGEDQNKWWTLDLGKKTSINRMQVHFPKNYRWQYLIEVSDDNNNWEKVIDQSENTTLVNYHYNYGNLGKDIQYVRFTFQSGDAGLAEVALFGGDNLPEKKNLLSGTVIGTAGSWDNNPSNTRDAVYDFNMDTFFDAPSGIGWAGLDLGTNAEYVVDSIRYAPRSGDYHLGRMRNGKFEIANAPNFTGNKLLHQVTQTPAFEYYLVETDQPTSGRYVRYTSPSDGFGNIAEVEFYGKRINTNTQSNFTDNHLAVFVDRNSHILSLTFAKEPNVQGIVNIYAITGSLVKQHLYNQQEVKISLNNMAKGAYVVHIIENNYNYRTKITL